MDLSVIYVRLKDRAQDLSQHWVCAASEVALDLKHTCEELMGLVEMVIAEKRANARIRDNLERRLAWRVRSANFLEARIEDNSGPRGDPPRWRFRTRGRNKQETQTQTSV
jgi:hypothetical protein